MEKHLKLLITILAAMAVINRVAVTRSLVYGAQPRVDIFSGATPVYTVAT